MAIRFFAADPAYTNPEIPDEIFYGNLAEIQAAYHEFVNSPTPCTEDAVAHAISLEQQETWPEPDTDGGYSTLTQEEVATRQAEHQAAWDAHVVEHQRLEEERFTAWLTEQENLHDLYGG